MQGEEQRRALDRATGNDSGRTGHAAFGWLPVVLLGAGLLLGVGLWAKWGVLIAFEAIRSYCFG